MNFPEIGPAHAPEIENSGWVFQDLPIRVQNKDFSHENASYDFENFESRVKKLANKFQMNVLFQNLDRTSSKSINH